MWPAASALADFSVAPLWLRSVLVHELVHVWQAQQGVFLPFAKLQIHNLFAVIGFALAASLVMGMAGVLAGLWSEKFDQLAAVQNFVVMPMTFLSGAFYLVKNLPEPFATLSHYNPFFYLIDGFRYGFIGHAESHLTVGVIGSAVLMAVMGVVCWLVFRSGWRLKS